MRFFRQMGGLLSCAALLLSLAHPVQAKALTFPTVANLAHGDVFKVEGSSTLSYFGKNDLRYLFPDAGTYFSWFENFDAVKTITSEQLSQIPLGGIVYYKPFDLLLKAPDDPTVYWVYTNGQLIPVRDALAAEAINGKDWERTVRTVDSATLGHYQVESKNMLNALLGANVDLVEGIVTAFIFGPRVTIAENQQMIGVKGISLFENPDRFVATDEAEDCGKSICFYNEVAVTFNGTLKFVNNTSYAVTIADDQGAWSTGKMPANGGIAIVRVQQAQGKHSFHVVENEEITGELTVQEADTCKGSYLCTTLAALQ